MADRLVTDYPVASHPFFGLHFFTLLTFTACWLCTSSKEGSPISAMVFADTVLVAVWIQGSNLRTKTVWPMARKSSKKIHHEDLPISEQLELQPRSQVSMPWWRTTRCSMIATACLFGNCPSWSMPDTVRHVRWQSIGMTMRDSSGRRCNKGVIPRPPLSFQKGLFIGLWNDTACSHSSISTHILILHWSGLLSRCLLIGLGWRGYLPRSSLWGGKEGSLTPTRTSSRQENQVY